MPKFIVTFMASGGITIETDTKEQAEEKFNNYPDSLLMDELNANGIEMTDIFTEDESDPESYNNEQERLHDEMIDAQEREREERYSDGL
jgi:hypothetical protein